MPNYSYFMMGNTNWKVSSHHSICELINLDKLLSKFYSYKPDYIETQNIFIVDKRLPLFIFTWTEGVCCWHFGNSEATQLGLKGWSVYRDRCTPSFTPLTTKIEISDYVGTGLIEQAHFHTVSSLCLWKLHTYWITF